MATASCLLSEEKFLCSVCLDVFTEPVSTPCGHNFCSACINRYWDNSDICQCPLCKRIFSPRPKLQVNTVMSELATEFKTLVQVKVSTPDPQLPETADVLCDICSDIKEKAVKSCLMCLSSFCEVHLEPHQRVAGLKSHTLLDPVKNLDERMCKTHNKITELYCRTNQACICALCFKTDHKGHNVVSLEEEYEAVMARKDETMANIQKMMQSHSEKIVEIENSVDVMLREAEKEKEASVQVFTDLISSIQRSQAELVEVIEERYRATKQKAESFLTELKMEVAELESRSNQLEQLSQSEDHHHFLQSFPTLCSPPNKDWSNIGVHSDLYFQAVRGAVTLLKQKVDEKMEELPEIKMKRMREHAVDLTFDPDFLDTNQQPVLQAVRGAVTLLKQKVDEKMEELPEIKMKRMREHAVDLTFDPDTANRSLVISQDGKQVIVGDTSQNLPHNPKRFEVYPDVLTKEGFTTGKFYHEVQVKGKTRWIVGVVRESVDRKKNIPLSVKNGLWTFRLDEGEYCAGHVTITLKEKLQKVGIFVDYDKGVVSFYDVDSKSHIYSYTGYHFTEKLYPYFGLQGNRNGTNSAPLIITPVPQTH